MKKYALLLSYDGEGLLGWQKNRDLPTVEWILQNSLEKILQHSLSLEGASRTDAGVHALGQVVSFSTDKKGLDPSRLVLGCNALLPPSIRVRSCWPVSESFHPSLDSKEKEYHYSFCVAPVQLPLCRKYEWHIPCSLDWAVMKELAGRFEGTHDFGAFANQSVSGVRENTIRTLNSLSFDDLGEGRWKVRVCGKRFLYKMVRNLVGTLVYVGAGKLSLEEVLQGWKEGERKKLGITAPAHGLVLYRIVY